MVTLENAKNIARNQYPNYPIFSITDIGDKWVFNYDTPVPDIPFVCINKVSGAVSLLTVPPLENLDIIENGKLIFSAE